MNLYYGTPYIYIPRYIIEGAVAGEQMHHVYIRHNCDAINN